LDVSAGDVLDMALQTWLPSLRYLRPSGRRGAAALRLYAYYLPPFRCRTACSLCKTLAAFALGTWMARGWADWQTRAGEKAPFYLSHPGRKEDELL